MTELQQQQHLDEAEAAAARLNLPRPSEIHAKWKSLPCKSRAVEGQGSEDEAGGADEESSKWHDLKRQGKARQEAEGDKDGTCGEAEAGAGAGTAVLEQGRLENESADLLPLASHVAHDPMFER